MAGQTHLGLVDPVLYATSFPRYIMKICMDFDPYGAFLLSDVPEMVDQQNA
jgi:hypothetical protein